MGVSVEKLKDRVEGLNEVNPMLGLRGCRLGIIYPEITEMQARAIFEAAGDAEEGKKVVIPEIMIPLVGHVNELKIQEGSSGPTAEEVMKEQGVKINYLVGTMIELPRGAITADQIAAVAEFFCFGTNDLTQMTFGLSRDDAGQFLAPTSRGRSSPRTRSIPSTGTASASSSAWASRRAARRARTSSRHLRRARRRPVVGRVLPPASDWTTSPARPTGCPSPGWPRPGRPS